MSIWRIACRHKPYSQLGNAMLRDTRISPEAVGVLCFILSHPPDWQFNFTWLCKARGVGRDKAQRIVRELIDCGYCQRRQPRKPDGTVGTVEYWFGDEIESADSPWTAQPVTAQPLAADHPPTKKITTKEGNLDKIDRSDLEPSLGEEGASSDSEVPDDGKSGSPKRTSWEAALSDASRLYPGWDLDWLQEKYLAWDCTFHSPGGLLQWLPKFIGDQTPGETGRGGGVVRRKSKTLLTIVPGTDEWTAWWSHLERLPNSKTVLEQCKQLGRMDVPTRYPREAA